ncbi:hypothetical protein BDF19DRAFT_442495 [Syncephalis fuscata]|nr:hypothetical protein BDF19DRAFT_442495 [Syncephalis fuscata]
MKHPQQLLLIVALAATVTLVDADPRPASDILSLAFSLSSSCRSYLMSKLNDNQLSRCLPIQSLMTLAGSELPEPEVFSSAVTSICRVSPCSDSLVGSIRKDVRSNCESDINGGSNAEMFHSALYVLDNYTPLRNATCVQAKDGELCAIESYKKVYPAAKDTPSNQLLEKIPQSDICSECNKGIATVLLQADQSNPGKLLNETTAKKISSRVADTCGKEYLNGNTTTASGDKAHAPSPASSLAYSHAIGLPLLALVVLSSIF